MGAYSDIIWIVGVLAAIFVIAALRKNAEIMINFVLRGVLGLFLIYFGNYFLAERIPEFTLGYNLPNFLASGFLGFPGILMLYGIRFYMLW